MLNEDTKIDLSGDIDTNNQTSSDQQTGGKIFGGMSLPVPINISQVNKINLLMLINN